MPQTLSILLPALNKSERMDACTTANLACKQMLQMLPAVARTATLLVAKISEIHNPLLRRVDLHDAVVVDGNGTSHSSQN